MMNAFLKATRTLPLEKSYVGRFLYAASLLVEIDVITVDDWKYLTRLLAFRVARLLRGGYNE